MFIIGPINKYIKNGKTDLFTAKCTHKPKEKKLLIHGPTNKHFFRMTRKRKFIPCEPRMKTNNITFLVDEISTSCNFDDNFQGSHTQKAANSEFHMTV